MSKRFNLRFLAVVVGASLALRPGVSRACGFDFPNRLLDGGDRAVLDLPPGDFSKEIDRIPVPGGGKGLPVAVNTDDPANQTAGVARNDLAKALESRGVTPAERTAILTQHGAVRDKLQAYSQKLSHWKERRGPEGDAGPKPTLEEIAVPDGLPGEFADYLRGAIAYHRGDYAEARRHWSALLDRPEADRPYRTTWAAFMIGKSYLDSDPAEAVAWFQRTRDLVAAGHIDNLGLGASSLGWEAMAETRRERYVQAIELYLLQRATGDHTATLSLRLVAKRALEAGPAKLRELAANDVSRRVMTAYAVARGGHRCWRAKVPAISRVRMWLEAIEAADLKEVRWADRLAWVAYKIGEMDLAQRWLARADTNSPIAKWIRAKLLLRAGEIDQAAIVLAEVARLFPEDEQWDGLVADGYPTWFDQCLPSDDVHGELGVLFVARRQYTEALDVLLRGGFWMDAAYVAERVLTPDELIRYVDQRWPAGKAWKAKKRTWRGIEDVLQTTESTEENIRYVLARRLTRIGRWKEARQYYPERLRPILDKYVDAIRAGHDKKRSKQERAASFWEAAQIARNDGMELLGTEVEPDWRYVDGSFDLGATSKFRAADGHAQLLASSDDERKRLQQHTIEPEQRFHYRYLASDHAWSAAALMPDQSDETARVLCVAGSWLKARDPEAADRFYKALVRRCRKTDLGRAADRLRWFPKVDETPQP